MSPNHPNLVLSELSRSSLFIYDHQASDTTRCYLIAFPEHSDEQSLEHLLLYGRQPQAIVNLDAWPNGEGPAGDAHQLGKPIPTNLSVANLKALAPALKQWDFHDCSGIDRILIRPFPRGDVLTQQNPESFILEALCHGEADVHNIWMSQISPLAVTSHEDAVALSQKLTIPLVTRADVVDQRHDNARLLKHTGTVRQTLLGAEFDVHSFYSSLDQRYHWAFTNPDFSPQAESPLARIEFECLTGHVFGSTLCSCAQHMEDSLERIKNEEQGILLYLRQGPDVDSGSSKCRIQKGDVDEEAKWNASLILKHFGLSRIKLLESQPSQQGFLEKHGLEITESSQLD